jgi:hypothetical protein
MYAMDPIVAQAIQYLATSPEVIAESVRGWQQECLRRMEGEGDAAAVAAQRERLERRLEGLEKKRQALVVAEGLLPEVLVSALSDLSSETTKTNAALSALTATDAETEARRATSFDPEQLAAEARLYLLSAERTLLSDKLPMKDRREALRSIADSILPDLPADPDYRPSKNEMFPHGLTITTRPMGESVNGASGACIVIHATVDGHFSVSVRSASATASPAPVQEVQHA